MTDNSPAQDLRDLIGHGEVEVGGKTLVVSAYGFLQVGRAEALAAEAGLLDGLLDLFGTTADPESIDLAALRRVLFRDPERLAELLALATGQPADWIQTLGSGDTLLLVSTWWAVNHGFFIDLLVAELGARAHRRARGQPGQPSSPPSSDTATPKAH
jgi:hypothetical protein